MALGVDDTLDLVLNYLESDPDANELAESLPYAAWRRLCMHICGEADFSAAEAVFSDIISKRPAVRGTKPCPAHTFVAELVLALKDSVVEGIDSAAALQPVLVSTASALFNSPQGPTQSAQIQLGMKMLTTLISACSSFCRYAAGHPALAAAMGRVLYGCWSTQVSTAVETLLDKLSATADRRTALLDSILGLITGNSSLAGQHEGTCAGPNRPAGLAARAHSCCLLEALLSTEQQNSNMAATAAGAMQGTAMQDVLKLLLDMQAAFAPAVACPAHASASTSAAHGRVLKLKLAGNSPAPAGNATVTAAAAGGAAASVAAHPAVLLVPVLASAQQPIAAKTVMPQLACDSGEGAVATKGAQAAPAQAAATGATVQPPQAPLLAAVAAALKAQGPATTAATPATASASMGLPASTGPIVTTILQTVATRPQQSPALPVPAPAISQKPMPPKLLQVLISTLAKLTEQQPMQMVQALVKSPGFLHIFLQLLDSSTKHPACEEDAASIVSTCLCWAAANSRYVCTQRKLQGMGLYWCVMMMLACSQCYNVLYCAMLYHSAVSTTIVCTTVLHAHLLPAGLLRAFWTCIRLQLVPSLLQCTYWTTPCSQPSQLGPNQQRPLNFTRTYTASSKHSPCWPAGALAPYQLLPFPKRTLCCLAGTPANPQSHTTAPPPRRRWAPAAAQALEAVLQAATWQVAVWHRGLPRTPFCCRCCWNSWRSEQTQVGC